MPVFEAGIRIFAPCLFPLETFFVFRKQAGQLLPLAFLLLIACNGGNHTSLPAVPPQQTDRGADLRKHGAIVLKALRDTDFQALAAYIHPQTGLRFSPYGHIDLFGDQKLNAQSLLRTVEARTRLSWGSYADGGATIVLSPQEYLRRFAYTANYLGADSVVIVQGIIHDETEQSIGNLYAGADYITYYEPGNGGYSSLRLIFAREETKYYLIGLMHVEAEH